MVVEQYHIVLADLNPTRGSEIKKTRPCLVISPNEMNLHLQTVIVAPMTSAIKNYPTRVSVEFQDKIGSIAIDQIRTIDKRRIIKSYHQISSSKIQQVKKILRETLVD